MEADIQRRIHLGKGEGLPIPCERIGGVGCRLVMTLLLEGRIVRSTFKEVHKGTVKMAKGLLQGNRGHVPQPRVLLFQGWQHSGKIVVVEALPMLEIGHLARREAPIVDEAAAAKRLSEYLLLLIRWVEAIFVGSLRLLAHGLSAFLLSLDILFQSRQDLSTQRAVMLLGNRFHLLQDVSRKADRERFDGFVSSIHASNFAVQWMHAKRLAPHPKPPSKERPLYLRA